MKKLLFLLFIILFIGCSDKPNYVFTDGWRTITTNDGKFTFYRKNKWAEVKEYSEGTYIWEKITEVPDDEKYVKVGDDVILFTYQSPTEQGINALMFSDKGVVDEMGNWWRYKKQ